MVYKVDMCWCVSFYSTVHLCVCVHRIIWGEWGEVAKSLSRSYTNLQRVIFIAGCISYPPLPLTSSHKPFLTLVFEWMRSQKSILCVYCVHICVQNVCVWMCNASCQGLQEMILQGAVLSNTCSVSFIVLSLFSHLICRDATKHTYLIWLLQGKASRSVWWRHLHGCQIRPNSANHQQAA